ncbi:hypothetical protein KKB55_22675 [Myxococcota bacterium]|nr:hypothetical protein [Myxococcota bacterium]MBU1900560.1 hypothetical protein [Myxococcota bacterium]
MIPLRSLPTLLLLYGLPLWAQEQPVKEVISFGSVEFITGFKSSSFGLDNTENGQGSKIIDSIFGFDLFLEDKIGSNVFYGKHLKAIWVHDPFSIESDKKRSFAEIDLSLRIKFHVIKNTDVSFLIMVGPSLWSSDDNQTVGIGFGRQIGLKTGYTFNKLKIFLSLMYYEADVRPISIFYDNGVDNPTIMELKTGLFGLGFSEI